MAPGLRLIKVAVWNSRMGLVGCFCTLGVGIGGANWLMAML